MLKLIRSVLGPLLILLLANTFSVSQTNQKLDSLRHALSEAPQDSTRVEILVNLWRATAYNNTKQSLNYAREIIKASKDIDFTIGLATGYQRLGISQAYLGLYDSALHNYKEALSIYEEIDDAGLQGVMLYNIGLQFMEKSYYDSAKYYINKAGELFAREGQDNRMGAVYEALGAISQEKGDYRIALQDFLKASEIFEVSGDSIRMSIIYIEIGNSFTHTKEYENAMTYYRNAKDIANRNDDLRLVTDATIKIGDLFNRLNKYDSAVLILEQSIALADSIASPSHFVEATSSLANAHFEQGNYKKALPLFQKALATAKEQDYTLFIGSILINIGWIHFHQGEMRAALDAAQKGLEVALRSDVKENAKSAYELLSKIYARQNNFESAYTYHLKFKNINDSLYNSTQSAQIAELQTLYETEKKEKEIILQKEKIQLLNQQARIERLRKFLLIAFLVAAVCIGAFVVNNYRQKIKRERVEREREKSDFEKELTFRKRQLTTHTLHLVQKNELLEDLSTRLAEIKKTSTDNKRELNRLLQLIKNDTQAEKDWENFKMYFEQVHEDFDQKLRNRINDLTNNEMRLAALMKMNLSTKEIATILNISPDSVNKARYRLRKKLDLSGDDSLTDFILAL